MCYSRHITCDIFVTSSQCFRAVSACNHYGMNEGWWDYVQRIAAYATNKEIAAAAGCDPSTVSHWKNGERPRADVVVALARAFNRPPLEGLMVAGYLTENDLEQPLRQANLNEVSDVELAAEMSRRLTTYSDVVAEMRRRYEAGDPRRIEPGSADDVFPKWSDGDDRKRG